MVNTEMISSKFISQSSIARIRVLSRDSLKLRGLYPFRPQRHAYSMVIVYSLMSGDYSLAFLPLIPKF